MLEKKVECRIKQGCQIFLAATYRNVKNIPNDEPNGHKIDQLAVCKVD
jgi:hypothetical protein